MVFIDRGQVLATGTHELLAATEPAYREALELSPEEVA